MKRYKGSPGWFNESQRHSLAAQGVKTGRKGYSPVMKPINYAEDKREVRKVTSFTDGEFEYTFQPIEDTIKVTELPDGYEVKYLAQDENPQSPDEWGDNNLFLVHYHRDFEVDRDNIITENDARDWYQGSKIEQEKDYWLVPIEAYIHSGVSLAISNEGNFPDRRWDVSHVGLALASKKEFKSKKAAEKAVRGLIDEWNQYLSGDVYGVVVEKYNKEKKLVDNDHVWGYYGYDYALEELKNTKYTPQPVPGQKQISDFAKFDVTGVALDRNTKKQIGKSRTETIDTEANVLFKGAKSSDDVKERYESFWNRMNPSSKEIVKVIDVKKK